MVTVFNVKNILPSKPAFIAVVIHMVAEPGRRENFRFLPRPVLLVLLRLFYAWLNELRIIHELYGTDFLPVQVAVAIFRIGIGGPYDIFLRGFILKQ